MQRMQVVMSAGQPVGIVTPTNVFNMLQDYIDADPDVDVTSKYITAPQHASTMSECDGKSLAVSAAVNSSDACSTS
jgi:hypothetical protein